MVRSRRLHDVLPLHLATVTFPAEVLPPEHPLIGTRGEVFGFAVLHREGLVLFDTGVGAPHPLIDPLYQPERHSLADALARHSHQLGDVAYIVNSHLHFDHCGNNPSFPGVPIYAQVKELEAARDPWYTVREWVEFPGAEVREIDGDYDLGGGIRILFTPGHTSAHQSLVVDTADGTVVLAGQAIYSAQDCKRIAVDTSAPIDREVMSARQLLALGPRRMHFSHDRDVWEPPNEAQ